MGGAALAGADVAMSCCGLSVRCRRNEGVRRGHRASPVPVPPCTAAEEQRGCLGGLFAASRAAASLGGFSPAPGSPQRDTPGLGGSAGLQWSSFAARESLSHAQNHQTAPKPARIRGGEGPRAALVPAPRPRPAKPDVGQNRHLGALVWGLWCSDGDSGVTRDSEERGLRAPSTTVSIFAPKSRPGAAFGGVTHSTPAPGM